MTNVIPIILSGGAGTRLWPVSRRNHPKPFMEVAGKPLICHALEIAGQISDKVIIITNKDNYHLTNDAVNRINKNLSISYLLEPNGRNTAPAISIGVKHIQEAYGNDTLCLVLAADHLITGQAAFKKAISLAGEQKSQLVLFGIRPLAPETGYGYLEVAALSEKPQTLQSFVEKPDRETAEKFLLEGRYYWNSGIFCFNASTMASALNKYAPNVWAAAQTAYAESTLEANIRSFKEESYCAQPNISIDYAVMEKARNITVVPAEFGWSDIGSWDAVARAQKLDENGNSIQGFEKAFLIDSKNSYVSTTSHVEKVFAALGVEDMVIVDMPDALLVAHRSKNQEVKTVVEALNKSSQASLTKLPTEVRRPWGTYKILMKKTNYQIKHITVSPRQKLSLQYHNQRSEHWILTHGFAIIQIGEKVFEAGPGQYFFIPLGYKHRLTNSGQDDLELIEVQVGDYLGEDDIVRLEDVYGRK